MFGACHCSCCTMKSYFHFKSFRCLLEWPGNCKLCHTPVLLVISFGKGIAGDSIFRWYCLFDCLMYFFTVVAFKTNPSNSFFMKRCLHRQHQHWNPGSAVLGVDQCQNTCAHLCGHCQHSKINGPEWIFGEPWVSDANNSGGSGERADEESCKKSCWQWFGKVDAKPKWTSQFFYQYGLFHILIYDRFRRYEKLKQKDFTINVLWF